MIYLFLILFVAFLSFIMGLIAKNNKDNTPKDKPQEVFQNPDALATST